MGVRRREEMDWTLIFTAIGAVATVISTIIAVKAKNESKRILEQIKEEHSRNIKNKGEVRVSNSGNNSGLLIGNNSGDIHK
jgi:hypothetical protein